jgi:signal transduction histidine kinase/ActR/RegA family two-component response regulator
VNGRRDNRPKAKRDVSKTLNEIRSGACNVILTTFTALAIIASAVSLLRNFDAGWRPVSAFHVALTLVLVFVTLRRHHLSLTLRATVVTAVPFLITIGGFLTDGRGNGTLMFMVTSCVLAGCFFDRRGALIALGVSFSALVVLFLGYQTGLLDVPVNPAIFNMTALSWTALGTGVILAAAVPLVGISALLESLETERARADEAARVRSDFLARISHELRTPMANIIGLAEVLKGTALNAHQHGVIANLVLSGHNLLAVFNDLLDFTKFEAGIVPLEKRPFNLADQIQNVCVAFEAKAEQKGLYFGIERAPELPEIVVGDNLRIGQALSNLIDNAIKFTSTGGVVVRAEQSAREDGMLFMSFKVIDTGIGIASNQSERIFEPFVQADTSTSRVYGGAGLGLPICRALARAMGGDVSISSELGGGSTFTLQVPLERGVAVSDVVTLPRLGEWNNQCPAAIVRRSQRTLRLLLADDDISMRTVAEIMLEERGHAVTLVEDGAAAVSAAGAAHYDCILVDMHMPGMNGPDAMRALRNTEVAAGTRRVPIIALSADVIPEHVRGFIEAGADAFVAKPVAWEALEAKMQELVGKDAADAKPALQAT